MKRFFTGIVLTVAGLVVALMFNNCGQSYFQGKSGDNIVVKLNDSQVGKISQAIQSGANLCAPETIICTERLYAPDVTDSDSLTEFCPNDMCMTLHKITYNSSVAFSRCSDCTLQDSEPGGRYNYIEAYCRSVGIDQITGVEYRAYADDLDSALDKLLEICK